MSFRKILLALLGILILGGCMRPRNIPLVNLTQQPTGERPTPLPSFLPLPSFTHSMVTPTPVPPTDIPTITLPPPLSEEAAYARLEELLKDISGCQLPCWWGILPGKSTLQDARTVFFQLKYIADDEFLLDIGKGYFGTEYKKDNSRINISIGYAALPGESRVSEIAISTHASRSLGGNEIERVFDSLLYKELLSNYVLSSVLSTYGIPSQVILTVEISAEQSGPDYLDIRLLYPEKGIFVNYQTIAEINGDRVLGCPSNAFIDLWLLPIDSSNTYQEILSQIYFSDWEGFFPNLESYRKTLDEATHMSINDFYQTFKKPTSRCLETSLSIWPKP